MKPSYPHRIHAGAFTLLEISIVLVIIGLIVGGVMVGRNLIRNAELNSIVGDVDKFRSAINSFKYQYGQIPGDFARSSSYWPSDCSPTPSYCDGDGNGILHNDHENLRFWSHLSSAGLISGKYSYMTVVMFVPTLLVPANERYRPLTRIKGGAYWAFEDTFDGLSQNVIGVGGAVQLSDSIDPLLTGPEVYAIDVKIDDGSLNRGTVRSFGSGIYAESGESAGDCALDSDDTGCAVVFLKVM